MNNNFDLERAKRGEPIQFSMGSADGSIPQRWVDVQFIGVMSNGEPVVEHKGGTLRTTALRMKPAPRYALVFSDQREYNGSYALLMKNGYRPSLLELPGDEP